MSVHPSGKVVMSVSKDHTIRLWNLITGKIAFTRSLKQYCDQTPSKVQWNQHSNGDYYLVIFDTLLFNFRSADNEKTCTIPKLKPGERSYTKITQANYCANGAATAAVAEVHIAVLFNDRTIRIYTGTGDLLSSLCVSRNIVNEFHGVTGGSSAGGNSTLRDLSVCRSDVPGDSNITVITTNGQLLVSRSVVCVHVVCVCISVLRWIYTYIRVLVGV